MKLSALGKLRRSVFRIGARPIRAFIDQAMRDQSTYDWLCHTMGNNIAMTESGIAVAIPADLTHIEGFEDCSWLYSSNPMNHGASRLRFDEAAHLYKLIRSMQTPNAVEIGRYKGGTTFLMAAAGAQVTSLDNGKIYGDIGLSESLINTLRQVGLENHANVVDADALDYPVESESYDLVLLDNGLDSFELGQRFFDYWWKGVKKGGYFLFRDGKDTVLHETARFVKTLADTQFDGVMDFTLPGAFVLCTKR